MKTATTYPEGSVVRYTSEREGNWCREGLAIAQADGSLFDTYWITDRHRLTPPEVETAELLFNLADYREIDGHNSRKEWEEYSPDDRQLITSQHGLRRRHFVRIGATPDLVTRIENARFKVERFEEKVRSANSDLEWAKRELAELEGEAAK